MTNPGLPLACRVRRLIAEFTGRPVDHITPGVRLYEDLGIGDMDHIALVMAVEALVEAEATDEQAEACKTVGQLQALAAMLAGETQSQALEGACA